MLPPPQRVALPGTRRRAQRRHGLPGGGARARGGFGLSETGRTGRHEPRIPAFERAARGGVWTREAARDAEEADGRAPGGGGIARGRSRAYRGAERGGGVKGGSAKSDSAADARDDADEPGQRAYDALVAGGAQHGHYRGARRDAKGRCQTAAAVPGASDARMHPPACRERARVTRGARRHCCACD